MTNSASDLQRQLDALSPSDSDYQPLLLQLLSHQDLRAHVLRLEGCDLQGFVELLDEALNHIPVTDDLFRKTLRRLQSTCGNRRILPRSYMIPSEKLSRRGAPVASGGFADAYQVEFDKKKVCIKALRLYTQDSNSLTYKLFYREVVVWKRLQHPNIVPFCGVPTGGTSQPLEIVCDWMENGTITQYLGKRPQADRVGLLWDVADGLHYLHLCGILHGDLKGSNVLIDKDGNARLTDFGLTSITRGDNSTRGTQDQDVPTTGAWAAPREVQMGGFMTKGGDIFMFAMMAVETYKEKPPPRRHQITAIHDILVGNHPKRPENLKHDELWKLMQRCWNKRSSSRPTTLELLDFFRTSFPRERRTPESQVLPSAPSTWSLTEVRTDEDTEPNPDPSIQRSEDLPVVQEGNALPQTQSNLSWSGQLMRKVKEAVKHMDFSGVVREKCGSGGGVKIDYPRYRKSSFE